MPDIPTTKAQKESNFHNKLYAIGLTFALLTVLIRWSDLLEDILVDLWGNYLLYNLVTASLVYLSALFFTWGGLVDYLKDNKLKWRVKDWLIVIFVPVLICLIISYQIIL